MSDTISLAALREKLMLADFATSGLDADDIKALEITTGEKKMPGWDKIHPS
jgi:hypothetical protein